MERSVLIINDWNPLTIVKKNLYINVDIVSIYMNVDVMLKSYDVSLVL